MHICIVGTGAAGLMAACLFKEKGYVKKISLVGSPHISTIGVGESTTLNFEELHQKFDDNFSNFVKESDASVKYGVYYHGWNSGKNWLHYFKTKEQTTLNGLDHLRYGISLGNKPKDVFIHNICGIKLFEYANNNQIVYEREKYMHEYPFSWHFDAGKYIKYLRSLCEQSKKIDMIYDTAISCEFKHENHIKSISKLRLKSGREINADFYINSTGASGKSGNVFQVEYQLLTDVLLTNKALFLPLNYKNKKEQFHPYTIAKTMKHGWRWITPTWSRIGTGYAFSSSHVSDDEAVKEFLEDIGDISLEPNVVDFTPKVNKETFGVNYCNIGMASGFLEPLDAPGLSIGISSVEELIIHFNSYSNRTHVIDDVHNQNHEWNIIISNLNSASRSNFSFWCAFILNQYKTCHRKDTEFWRDHTAVEYDYYDFLIRNLTNSDVWPDDGSFLMFHQTLASRNIQWDTGMDDVPIALSDRDAPTLNHYDFIKAIRDGYISV